MKITGSKNQPIEGASFLDLAKSFLDGINKGWDILKSWGLEIEQDEKEKANNIWSIKLGNDETMECKVTPIDKQGSRVDLEFKNTSTGKTKLYKDKPRKADLWYKIATDAAEALYGPATVEEFFNKDSGEYISDNDEDNAEKEAQSAESSTRCKLKLKKVMCSEGYEVQMCAIDCPSSMASSVRSVLNNEEFIDQLSEDEKCFVLDQDGDTISVDGCEPFELDEYRIVHDALSLMETSASIMVSFQYWKWNCVGPEKAALRDGLSDLLWCIEDQVEKYAEWLVLYNQRVPNIYLSPIVCKEDGIEELCVDTITQCARDAMNNYIEYMNLLYCNFPHNLQAELDAFINVCTLTVKRRLG